MSRFSTASGASISEGADSLGSAPLQEVGDMKQMRDAPIERMRTKMWVKKITADNFHNNKSIGFISHTFGRGFFES
jgi:hypothetical protein